MYTGRFLRDNMWWLGSMLQCSMWNISIPSDSPNHFYTGLFLEIIIFMTILIILQMPWIKPSVLSDSVLTLRTLNPFRHLGSLTDRCFHRKTRIFCILDGSGIKLRICDPVLSRRQFGRCVSTRTFRNSSAAYGERGNAVGGHHCAICGVWVPARQRSETRRKLNSAVERRLDA